MNLSNHTWKVHYELKYNNFLKIINKFQNVKANNDNNWGEANKVINSFNAMSSSINDELIFKFKKPSNLVIINLSAEANSIKNFYKENFNLVIKTNADKIFSSETYLNNYPWVDAKYELKNNRYFQSYILNLLNQKNIDEIKLFSISDKVKWLSMETKQKIDIFFSKKVRTELLKDGVIKLDEVLKFSELTNGVFKTLDKKSSFFKIGFVDTTSPQFKNSNRFDFKVSIKNDIKINFVDMTSKFLSNTIDIDTDFLFMMNLTSANVRRKFKDKDTPNSTFQSGTRQDPNPDYIGANTSYQAAFSRYNAAQMRGNDTSHCRGQYALMCASIATMANIATMKLVSDKLKDASANLSATPQTLSKPVYQDYKYRLVDVNSNKTASFEFLLINLKNKEVTKSFVDINDNEMFTIVYDVHPNDPNKSALISDYSTELKVASWEKNNVDFNISKLLNPNNLKKSKKQFFVNIKDLQSNLITASNKTRNKIISGNNIFKSGAIADPRFNSVLVVKAGSGSGTGFYVSPDIILTAYHVVEKSALVQLKSYNGRQTSGRIIAHDIRLDLALIKAEEVGIPLEIFSGNINLGSTVEAIGHPQGLSFTITRGVVSSLRKMPSIYTKGSAKVEFIQSDTPVSPGNSGGPLFIGNKVIGVVDFGNVEKFSQNLNFSVSYNEILNFLKRNKIQ